MSVGMWVFLVIGLLVLVAFIFYKVKWRKADNKERKSRSATIDREKQEEIDRRKLPK